MREFVISKDEQGVRLDKQLLKILNNSGSGFIYKMLRKKNITLNDARALGSERLKCGDVIRIYFSDDTFNRLSSPKVSEEIQGCCLPSGKYETEKLIIYEDGNFMILNKPSGLLSQKAGKDDFSLNELCIEYLIDKGVISSESLLMFKPSICNRLDRNTSGIVIFACNYAAARTINEALYQRTIHKYYLCIVKGTVKKEGSKKGFLIKDGKSNSVVIDERDGGEGRQIETAYRPLVYNDEHTLLEVELITGRSHQIRAQMASIGHPLLGDNKYGDKALNRKYHDVLRGTSQLLHAYKLVIPGDAEGVLKAVAGTVFKAPLPQEFVNMCDRLGLKYDTE